MQPHQWALAISILFLITLVVMALAFAKASRQAFNNGMELGLSQRDAAHTRRVKKLTGDIDEIAVQREAEQRKHLTQIAAFKGTITELEARIMSYTGLAVTKADYEKMVSAASTMRLAQRTFKALKTDAEAIRAGDLADVIDELAKRIHAQLRNTSASTATTGAAA